MKTETIESSLADDRLVGVEAIAGSSTVHVAMGNAAPSSDGYYLIGKRAKLVASKAALRARARSRWSAVSVRRRQSDQTRPRDARDQADAALDICAVASLRSSSMTPR